MLGKEEIALFGYLIIMIFITLFFAYMGWV